MPEFRIDLHCHSHYSADGVSHPLQMVGQARETGLNGFVLTDHDTQQGIEYFSKRGLVRDDGESADDFLIIPGMEVSTREGHVLVIGVRLDPKPGISCNELLPLVQGQGGLCIAAHPFDRLRSGVGRRVLDNYGFDGIEVFNAASWFPGFNTRAFHYAHGCNQLMTAGSDSHHLASLGRSHQIVQAAQLSVGSVMESLRRRSCSRHEQLMRPEDYILKSWYNVVRPETPVDESERADSLI
ncbi:MAG: CehA/McbA family metallohydrolase [Verrucomicrobiota bacterium]